MVRKLLLVFREKVFLALGGGGRYQDTQSPDLPPSCQRLPRAVYSNKSHKETSLRPEPAPVFLLRLASLFTGATAQNSPQFSFVQTS